MVFMSSLFILTAWMISGSLMSLTVICTLVITNLRIWLGLLACTSDFLSRYLFKITWQSSRHIKFSKSKAKLSILFLNQSFLQVHLLTWQLHYSSCSGSKTDVILETSSSLRHLSFFYIPHLINQQSFKICARFYRILLPSFSVAWIIPVLS